MLSQQSVAYVKARYQKANPKLAGRELPADEAKELFTLLAEAYDAGQRLNQRGTITVSDSLGVSHFHPDGRVEHEARK